MLQKNRISGIKIYSDEWKTSRLGKFTSSGISKLMQPKLYTDGFMSHIYKKVSEELTSKSSEPELDFDAVRWGNFYEAEALQRFGKAKGLEFLIVQQLITVPDTRYGSTPDGLIVLNESVDQTAYNVSTVEVKCFPTFERFMELALCKTPEAIKKINPELYWQVLDQMDNCDCLIGYSVAFHPDFKAGNLRIVEFRKAELLEDYRFLKERKKLATEKFEEVRTEFLNLGGL